MLQNTFYCFELEMGQNNMEVTKLPSWKDQKRCSIQEATEGFVLQRVRKGVFGGLCCVGAVLDLGM